MIVLPAASTVVAPAGIGVEARGPTATMRSPRITTTPSSMMPPSSAAMVTSRAPVIATVPLGFTAACSIARLTPVVGGTKPGAPSARGSAGKSCAVSTV